MCADAIRETLSHLTAADISALTKCAKTRSFKDRAQIVEHGKPAKGIMLVRSGFVTIERSFPQGQVVFARCGPGQVIGEVSFVERGGATADVYADGPVKMDVIELDVVEDLLKSKPAFSSRFFRSLAVVLAARLNQATERIFEMSGHEVVELDQLHTPQTGQVTERQLPDELVNDVYAFVDTMRSIERQAREKAENANETDKRVAASCDDILGVLEKFTKDDTLLEMAYDDLLAFRDESQVGLGVGDTVFREAYPFLMTSAKIARCYMKPRGFSDDHEMIETLYRTEAEGDGVLGPSVDRWFSSRPLCQSRRNVRDMVVKHVKKAISRHSSKKNKQVVCLASGHAPEIFDILSGKAATWSQVTCIDRDDAALLSLAERAKRRGLNERIRLVHGGLMRLARGSERCDLPQQDVIYGIGLCEYFDDTELVDLLGWIHAHLGKGGLVVLTNLHGSNPDQTFMKYLLDMQLRHRTEDELRAIFAESAFSRGATTIQRDETKANMVVTCTKKR